MKKILSLNQLDNQIKKLKSKRQTICLVGGCFDILHPGHVIFLQQAKKQADKLVVILESDQKVRALKGKGRPVQAQRERAFILGELEAVDYVIMLPPKMTEKEYDQIVSRIEPKVIAYTKNDPGIDHKKRAAKLVGAKLQAVTKKVIPFSSSRLANFLNGSAKLVS